MSIFNEIIPFLRKINPKKGISQLDGIGSPEGVETGYVGQWYLDTDANESYRKDTGDNTKTGWGLKAAGGGGGGDFETGDYTQSARSTKVGWLLCDGQAVSRTTYSNLFSLISTSFGNGDGSTTFNLPDFQGKVFGAVGQGSGLTNRILGSNVGAENHLLQASESGLASHTHPISGNALDNNVTIAPNVGGTGAFPYVRDSNGSIYNDGGYDGMKFFQDNQSTYHFATDVDWILKRDATLSVSQNSSANASVAHNNMQPTLFAGNTFIKY